MPMCGTPTVLSYTFRVPAKQESLHTDMHTDAVLELEVLLVQKCLQTQVVNQQFFATVVAIHFAHVYL